MKVALLFSDEFMFEDLLKKSSQERYKLAKSEEVSDGKAKVIDLEELSTLYNNSELDYKRTWLFFEDVEEFRVEVPDMNIEKFSDDYGLYIEDSVVKPYDTHLCTLIAPKEVKEEIEGLYEEGIFIA